MTMDIGSVEDISAFQSAITRQQIDMAVLKKTLDVTKAQAQAAIELVETAAVNTDQPQRQGSRHLDVKI